MILPRCLGLPRASQVGRRQTKEKIILTQGLIHPLFEWGFPLPFNFDGMGTSQIVVKPMVCLEMHFHSFWELVCEIESPKESSYLLLLNLLEVRALCSKER